MKKIVSLLFFLLAWSFCNAATYNPNRETGKISMTIGEASVSSFLKVYDNSGYRDFGLVSVINRAAEQVDEVDVEVKELYFHDFMLNLDGDMLNVSVKSKMSVNFDLDVGDIITLSPTLDVGRVGGKMSLFLEDVGVSLDDKIHMNLCFSNTKLTLSHVNVGGNLFYQGVQALGNIVSEIITGKDLTDHAEDYINELIRKEMQNMTDNFGCIDLAEKASFAFPTINAPVSLQSASVRVKDHKIIASACPVPKNSIDGTVSISGDPCELVTYKIVVKTGEISSAGTDANITGNLCGKDENKTYQCVKFNIPEANEKGDYTPAIEERGFLLVDDLSFELTSDNSGDKPGWFVDSVALDIVVPNGESVHRWFPFHQWIEKGHLTAKVSSQTSMYKVSVVNGHEGADSDVFAKICGTLACIDAVLDNPELDDQEANTTDEFYFVTDVDIGKMTSLTLYKGVEYAGGGGISYHVDNDNWFATGAIVSRYDMGVSKDLTDPTDYHAFVFNQMFNPFYADAEGLNEVVQAKNFSINPVNPYDGLKYYREYVSTMRPVDNPFYGYNVSVTTADVSGAGTDADVTLTLVGCSGEEVSFNLDDESDNFERGDVDRFYLYTRKNLKGIKSFKLGHNNKNGGAEWTVSGLSVKSIVPNGSELKTEEFSFEKNVSLPDEKSVWTENIDGACADMIPGLKDINVTTSPGYKLFFKGKNLDVGNRNQISLTLDNVIYAEVVTADYIGFSIPKNTAINEYKNAALNLNGIIKYVNVNVRGAEPIVSEISATIVHPDDALAVTGTNFDKTATFYLGNYILTKISETINQVILKIPDYVEDGIYALKLVQGGWEVPVRRTIQVFNPLLPHITWLSKTDAQVDDLLEIVGSNFGDDINEVNVFVAGIEAKVLSVSDKKIQITVPSKSVGKDLPVRVSRGKYYSKETMTLNVKENPSILSFDNPEIPWTSVNSELTYDDSERIGEDGYSLKIHGSGYKVIVSPTFETKSLRNVTNNILLDVWIPSTNVNPYWLGDVQMFVDIHAANLYNAWIGIALLSDLKPGWNTVSISVSEDIYDALKGDFAEASFTIALNSNQGEEDYRIDNIRFGEHVNDNNVVLALAYNLNGVKEW